MDRAVDQERFGPTYRRIFPDSHPARLQQEIAQDVFGGQDRHPEHERAECDRHVRQNIVVLSISSSQRERRRAEKS
jgi:hypothetical protein